jgi:hypothetical protein
MLFLGPKCTKAHLRASLVQKKIFRLANARHKGEGRKGRGGEAGGPLGRPPMLAGLLLAMSDDDAERARMSGTVPGRLVLTTI